MYLFNNKIIKILQFVLEFNLQSNLTNSNFDFVKFLKGKFPSNFLNTQC